MFSLVYIFLGFTRNMFSTKLQCNIDDSKSKYLIKKYEPIKNLISLNCEKLP